LTSFD